MSTFDPIVLAVAAVFALVLFVIVWAGMGVTRAREDMANRLELYGRQSVATAREDELAKPLAQRTVGPLVIGVGNFLKRFTPVGYLEKKQRKLMLAGYPGNLDAPAFTVIKLLTTAAGLIAGFVIMDYGADPLQRVVLFVLPIVLGFFGPDAWLERKVDERRQAMLRARVGVSRRDAMRHLMERTDLDELRSFLLAMIQAEAFGVTIARVLRVQADEMRVKRRQRAQEKAFAAPVKLVFPLVFCIFPALFIVLLGPAAIQISENFINR
jgi:tight adherence protein C